MCRTPSEASPAIAWLAFFSVVISKRPRASINYYLAENMERIGLTHVATAKDYPRVRQADQLGRLTGEESERCKVYESLGNVILNVYHFIGARYARDMVVRDFINSESVQSNTYFQTTQGVRGFPPLYFVRPDRLPFDLTVKAVIVPLRGKFIDKPTVETCQIDPVRFAEELKRIFEGKLTLNGRRVVWKNDEGQDQVIVQLKTFMGNLPKVIADTPREQLKVKRTEMVLLPEIHDLKAIDLAVRVTEMVHNHSLYCEDDRPHIQELAQSSSGGRGRMEMRQEMRQMQMQVMKQEQVPAMRQIFATRQIIQRSTILQMNQQQLAEKIRQAQQDLGVFGDEE